MILVMPSDGLWGDGSAYLNHNGKDFEKWIVDEVPRLVCEVTGNAADAPLFISGLSMGGYGALRMGAAYPERFAAFSGHSSITRFSEIGLFVEEPLAAYAEVDEEESSVATAMLRNRDRLPPFRFDCGADDPLIDGNRRLHTELQEAGIECSYNEFPGGHEWPYWIEHIRETFLFFDRTLGQCHQGKNRRIQPGTATPVLKASQGHFSLTQTTRH
jgi:S-formylglutathione hydrolase FrmB